MAIPSALLACAQVSVVREQAQKIVELQAQVVLKHLHPDRLLTLRK